MPGSCARILCRYGRPAVTPTTSPKVNIDININIDSDAHTACDAIAASGQANLPQGSRFDTDRQAVLTISPTSVPDTRAKMSSSSSKRHSILPPVAQAGPKAPVRFSSSLVISDSAILTGAHTIQLRTESLVHPRAKIESLGGGVDIGKRCVVHERTHVGVLPAGDRAAGKGSGAAVTIMDYCTVEVGSTIEAGGTVIGEGTIVGVGSRIGSGAVVGKVIYVLPSLSRTVATRTMPALASR